MTYLQSKTFFPSSISHSTIHNDNSGDAGDIIIVIGLVFIAIGIGLLCAALVGGILLYVLINVFRYNIAWSWWTALILGLFFCLVVGALSAIVKPTVIKKVVYIGRNGNAEEIDYNEG